VNGNGQDESFAALTQKPKSKKDMECYNCQKKGHIKANCWVKGSGKEGQGPKWRQGSTQANAAVVSEKPKDESWAIIEVINDKDNTMAATTEKPKDKSWAIIEVINNEDDTMAATMMTMTHTNDQSHTELYDSGTS